MYCRVVYQDSYLEYDFFLLQNFLSFFYFLYSIQLYISYTLYLYITFSCFNDRKSNQKKKNPVLFHPNHILSPKIITYVCSQFPSKEEWFNPVEHDMFH